MMELFELTEEEKVEFERLRFENDPKKYIEEVVWEILNTVQSTNPHFIPLEDDLVEVFGKAHCSLKTEAELLKKEAPQTKEKRRKDIYGLKNRK